VSAETDRPFRVRYLFWDICEAMRHHRRWSREPTWERNYGLFLARLFGVRQVQIGRAYGISRDRVKQIERTMQARFIRMAQALRCRDLADLPWTPSVWQELHFSHRRWDW
jgi:hypothetical protein